MPQGQSHPRATVNLLRASITQLRPYATDTELTAALAACRAKLVPDGDASCLKACVLEHLDWGG